MKKVIAVLVLFSTMIFAQQKGTFTDPRDNKTYKTVKIISQTWMAENLNYAASGSKCNDNNPENCKKYGRLYDWYVAMEVCPSGWHLPSNAEWDVLMAAVNGEEVAGKKLKAKSGWNNSYEGKSGNGTDQYGFSALPGGYSYSDGSFDDVGYYGRWWSASGAYRRIYYDDDFAGLGYGSMFNLYSVRCLKDDGFRKIRGAAPVGGETSKLKTASPSAAGGVFTDNSLVKCPNGSYVNSQGNTVCRPSSSNTGGATAVCNDGTYSYSQNRQGTCSKHGGVARWL